MIRPSTAGTPVLVEIPHSGLSIPDQVRGQVHAPTTAIWRDADLFVDRLYADAPTLGASVLRTEVSRYVVDLNRAPDDVDAQTVLGVSPPHQPQPRGVIWRVTTDGQPVLKRPLTTTELATRIREFHAPYHDALRTELEHLRSNFGHAILLAAHSMPSIGRAAHGDTGVRRADVVPGTRGRTTASPKIIDLVDAHFREAGLEVRHDDPYKGGWTTGHYGRPREHWHAVQIELNRDLYLDEATFQIKRREFEELRELLLDLVRELGALRM